MNTVLSLGGSLIVPDDVDAAFLRSFHTLITNTLQASSVIVVCGGGKTARRYQQGLAEALGDAATPEQLDWIGIDASYLNARLVWQLFEKVEHKEGIITDPRTVVQSTTKLTIAAGWKPGHSTDYDAVQLAIANGFTRVVNLSNISNVYDKDPNQYDDAQPLTDMTWDQMLAVVGTTWTPGLNMPFDPIASALAKEHNIEVVIANGTDIQNVERILNGQKYTGTTIHN